MKEIKNIEEKEELAKRVKALILQLNKEVEKANDLGVHLKINQQPPMAYLKNSHVTVLVSESIYYHV
jgi:hypothetical protein